MSDCSSIHAYRKGNIICPLHEHLYNTLIVTTTTSLINRIVVIAKRLKQVLSNFNQVEDRIVVLLLLQPLLHDIGKALSEYQNRDNYYLHEFISGVVVYELLTKINWLNSFGEQQYLMKLLVYPILNHHYSMRNLYDYDRLREREVNKLLKSLEKESSRVSIILDCLIKRVESDEQHTPRQYYMYLLEILEKMRDSTEAMKDVKDVKHYVRLFTTGCENKLFDRTINIFLSALTGIVNVADYLTACIERSCCNETKFNKCMENLEKKFVSRVLSSKEIEHVLKIIKPCC